MARIWPFTDAERWCVEQTLRERYGKTGVPVLQDVETEIRLTPGDRELTVCPGLYWEATECKFCISKTGDSRFRPMFFYRVRDRFTTDPEEYDDLAECVSAILKFQADTDLQRQGVFDKDS